MHNATYEFPSPDTADKTGLVTTTQDLTPEMLLAAYSQGLFPWTDNPVGWYSPTPRAIFVPDHVHLPRNLPKLARRGRFTVTLDSAFEQVMRACAESHAADGVWISERFVQAYTALHARGHAHSVEVWQDHALVGGLYGVQVGQLFAGESMFYRVSNASKVAFAALLNQLRQLRIGLFDAQVINQNTYNLGAVLVHRHDYLALLRQVVPTPLPQTAPLWRL